MMQMPNQTPDYGNSSIDQNNDFLGRPPNGRINNLLTHYG
jgi:hypothetical protein